MTKNIGIISLSILLITITFNGCSNKEPKITKLEKQLQRQTAIIAQQQEDVNSKNTEISILKQKLSDRKVTVTNKNTIKKIQTALLHKGYKPGIIDGIFGRDTQNALTAFQTDNNLQVGTLTLESLAALGIQ